MFAPAVARRMRAPPEGAARPRSATAGGPLVVWVSVMGCGHYYPFVEGGDTAFSVDANSIKYGPGVLR